MAEGHIDLALKNMIVCTKYRGLVYHNSFIQLSAKLNEADRSYFYGFIEFHIYEAEKGKIANRILLIVDKIFLGEDGAI